MDEQMEIVVNKLVELEKELEEVENRNPKNKEEAHHDMKVRRIIRKEISQIEYNAETIYGIDYGDLESRVLERL